MLPVILVGFMGTGKTTVGEVLAQKLAVPQYDLDQVIESQLQTSISQYFDQHGEAAFREVETQVLSDYILNPGVLSTGGGVVMTDRNRDVLGQAKGLTVYLKTSPQEIRQRLQGDTKRPLLQQLDEMAFTALWQRRDPLYEEVADCVVVTDQLTPVQIAETIINQLNLIRM